MENLLFQALFKCLNPVRHIIEKPVSLPLSCFADERRFTYQVLQVDFRLFAEWLLKSQQKIQGVLIYINASLGSHSGKDRVVGDQDFIIVKIKGTPQ